MNTYLFRATKIMAIAALTALSACTSERQYTANQNISPADAKAVIAQVIMEQHPSKRPTYLDVTDEYIDFTGQVRTSNSGVVVGGGFVVSRGKSRQDVGRVYFREIGQAQFFKRKSWYGAQLTDHDGNLMKNYYTKSEMKAKRFIDAVMLLKSQAHDPFNNATSP